MVGCKKGFRVHYAWVVLAVSFTTLIVAAAVRLVPGIILKSLEQEFAWSRETITLAVSINMLLFGLAGPFLGRLMDNFGPRIIVTWTVGLIALGAAGAAFMQEPWHMQVLWGVIVGAGSGGCSMVMGSAVVNRWFVARRGLALGILGAAMSAGQLIFTPILMHLDIAYGWRSVTLSVALLMAVVVLPLVVVFLRDNPSKMGLRAYGEINSMPETTRPDTHPMRRAMQTPEFWLLASSFGICGLTTSGLFQTHLIPYGLEHGFSEMTMAVSLGVMGATDILGTIASGWICDRFGKRGPLAVYYLLRGASLLALPYINGPGELMLFSVFYGLNWLSTVPATSALTADLFGKQNVGTVFGWIFFAHQFGAAVAAYGASILHRWGGDYAFTFSMAGVFAMLGTGLVLCIRRESYVPVKIG